MSTPGAEKWDVVVIGEFFIDEVLSEFSSLPKLGEESFARRFRRDVGGGAAITACGLAKLGARVAVLGAVGRQDGAWLIERLSGLGVDASRLEAHADEPTGLTVSVSTREDRAFFSYYGANKLLPDILKQPQTRKVMTDARHVHFACTPDPLRDGRLLSALRRRKCRISVDVAWHPSWLTEPGHVETLKKCDLFLPNEREAELMSGEADPLRMLRFFREKGLRGVGLKLGGKGAALLWKKQEFLVDAHPVSSLDTTGAGDCFNAGFIFAWLRDEAPLRCLETANICGALSTRALGGIDSFPSLKELMFELKSRQL